MFKKCLIIIFFTKLIFANETLTIGATAVPHAEILKNIIPELKAQGVDLKVIEFSDYIQPNLQLQTGELDANFFQHRPYLEQFNKERKSNLRELVAVEIEPMGIYISDNDKLKLFIKSKNVKSLVGINNLTLAVPNDVTNEGRALLLLEKYKFITLNKKVRYPSKKDVILNPYNITIKELDAAMLPRVFISKQVDIAVINSNFAILAKLSPLKDAMFVENKTSPYVNIIAVQEKDLHLSKIEKLKKVLQNNNTKTYILKKYNGSVIPVF